MTHLTRSTPLVLLALASTFAIACSSETDGPGTRTDGPIPTAPVQEARSDISRERAPNVSPSDRDAVADGAATFAVNAYQAVGKTPDYASKNFILSPYSISSALAMTYGGARGQTASEMKETMHYTLPDEQLHASYNWVDLQLASRAVGKKGQDGQPFRLNVANSTWGHVEMPFEKPYLDLLAKNYGAGIQLVDFVKDTEAARKAINGWTADKTAQKITEIIPTGAINGNTRMVLVNAIYMNAAWAEPFEARLTKPESFTRLDGSTSSPSTMTKRGRAAFERTATYDAFELPYDGNDVSMVVVAPTAGSFASFESSMTGSKMLSIWAGLKKEEVIVHLPKFKSESDLRLGNTLKELGMKTAFSGDADFSGMSPDARKVGLHIGDVLHKTFMNVDERGIEAAAATAVIMAGTAAPDPKEPAEIKVDRPFVVAIIDRPTRTVLFLGRILDPK